MIYLLPGGCLQMNMKTGAHSRRLYLSPRRKCSHCYTTYLGTGTRIRCSNMGACTIVMSARASQLPTDLVVSEAHTCTCTCINIWPKETMYREMILAQNGHCNGVVDNLHVHVHVRTLAISSTYMYMKIHICTCTKCAL